MNQNVTILCVDDEPINLKLFELNFKKKYRIVTALSGMEGLTKLEEDADIIVVVSDMKMPRMNGIEFIREARQKHPHVIYFILTGFSITPEISEALQENIIHKYFSKPLDPKLMEKAIDEAIQSYLTPL